MRNLLHSRRGSAAFATVIALVPLIGVVALGAEAGSWYVTHQHAQNAADAAAYSGALRLACTIAGAGGAGCDTSVDYHGKEFAAQNAFWNSGDTTAYPGTIGAPSLPSGISHAVQIAIGDYDDNAGTFTTPAAGNGNAVRARVSQQQPAYLAAVLGLTTVNIPAQAIAAIRNPTKLCALALGPDVGALKLAGSLSNNGTGCGLMSDSTVQLASTPAFTGSGWAVYGSSGCTPSGTCSAVSVPHNYFMPYALDPLQDLKTASFNSTTGSSQACGKKTITNGITCNLTPLSTAFGDLTVNSGGTLNLQAGTYFFYNASVNLGGTVTGTGVTLVLLGSSSLSINGGGVKLSAPTGPRTPTSPLNGVLIDDQATGAVNINGNGAVQLGGAMYFPNTGVSFGGTAQPTNTTCSEVIAKTLTMSGGAYLSTQGCAQATIARSQVVTLVQ